MNKEIVIANFKIQRDVLLVVGVYAPEEGKEEETVSLYEDFQRGVN